MVAEGIVGRRRQLPGGPSTIVVIRLHAFGDAAITLPIIGGLRERFPDARITLVTAPPSRDLFDAIEWIDQVVPARGSGQGYRSQVVDAFAAARRIGPVDMVLDLQRSRASRLLRFLLRPCSWASFDRFAPRSALDRYLDALRWVGLEVTPRFDPPLRPDVDRSAENILERAGWRGEPLVCMNPAGCWPTKNWPHERYIELGRILLREWGMRTVLIGTGTLRSIGDLLAREIDGAIDCVGATTSAQALALVRRLSLMVTDDSGLMHLASVCDVPTVALFGATRATWSAPAGPRSILFASEDMECGACMRSDCARGDLECLKRVAVREVVGNIELYFPFLRH